MPLSLSLSPPLLIVFLSFCFAHQQQNYQMTLVRYYFQCIFNGVKDFPRKSISFAAILRSLHYHHRRRRCHFHHHDFWVYVIQHLLINMHLIFDGILTSYRFYSQSLYTLYVCISSSHFLHKANSPDTIFGIKLLFDFVCNALFKRNVKL